MDNQNMIHEENSSATETEPKQEQYTYTESWMNQNNHSFNSINRSDSIPKQPNQGTNPYQYQANNPYNQGYGQAFYNTSINTPPKKEGIGFSIAGMICGIISIMACIFMFLDLLISIPGLVLSIVALAKKYDGKGMAIAGVVCNAIGTALSTIIFVIVLLYT